jgi:hypothetical protein
MNAQKLQRTGLKTALLTLGIGGLIFFAYYQTLSNVFIYLEYFFIFIVCAINLIVLLRILTYTQKHKRGKKGLYAVAALIFVALLASLAFFKYTSNLADTMQISLVNKTGAELSSVRITGCKKIRIDNMLPGEKENVWVRIKRDCSIELSYNQGGTLKSEVISAYVTTSMGKKITYEIGKH